MTQHDREKPRHEDRFAAPRACVVVSKNGLGTPAYGLHDKPGLRVLKHVFEQQKAADNVAVQERMNAVPGHHHYQRVYHLQVESNNTTFLSQTERGDKAVAAASSKGYREYDTSTDNPLCIPQGKDVDATPIFDQANKTLGKLTYARGSTIALADNLDSTLVPHNRFGMGDLTRVSSAFGSDAPRATVEQYHQQLVVQGDMQKRLLHEYPHGVPKRVLQQLRAQGSNGSSLPTLGYGIS